MATTALFAKGTKLKRKNPTTLLYEDVPQATVLNTPQVETDYDDVSNHDSPSAYKEWLPTMKDAGEISFDLIWNPGDAMHAQLFTDNVNGTLLDWKIVLPNVAATTFSFSAYVSKFGGNLEYSKGARLSCGLKVTGAPALS